MGLWRKKASGVRMAHLLLIRRRSSIDDHAIRISTERRQSNLSVRRFCEPALPFLVRRPFADQDQNSPTGRTILQAFAEQAGVEITSCADDDDVLLDAEMNLLAYFNNNADSGSPDESFNATLNGITKQLMGMKDSELRTMPNDLRNLLLEEAHSGRLDQELARRLIHVFEGK